MLEGIQTSTRDDGPTLARDEPDLVRALADAAKALGRVVIEAKDDTP